MKKIFETISGPTSITKEKLEKKLFIYSRSNSDRDYFRRQIYKWLRDDKDDRTIEKLCWMMVWEQNNRGETKKYIIEKENQSASTFPTDPAFIEWAKLIADQMQRTIKTYKL